MGASLEPAYLGIFTAFLSSSPIYVTVIRVMNRSIKASLRTQNTLPTLPNYTEGQDSSMLLTINM